MTTVRSRWTSAVFLALLLWVPRSRTAWGVGAAEGPWGSYWYALLLYGFRLLIELPLTVLLLRKSVRRLIALVPFLMIVKAISFGGSLLLGSALDPPARAIMVAAFDVACIGTGYRFVFRDPQAERTRSLLLIVGLVAAIDVVGYILGMVAQLPLFTLYVRILGTVR